MIQPLGPTRTISDSDPGILTHHRNGRMKHSPTVERSTGNYMASLKVTETKMLWGIRNIYRQHSNSKIVATFIKNPNIYQFNSNKHCDISNIIVQFLIRVLAELASFWEFSFEYQCLLCVSLQTEIIYDPVRGTKWAGLITEDNLQ